MSLVTYQLLIYMHVSAVLHTQSWKIRWSWLLAEKQKHKKLVTVCVIKMLVMPCYDKNKPRAVQSVKLQVRAAETSEANIPKDDLGIHSFAIEIRHGGELLQMALAEVLER